MSMPDGPLLALARQSIPDLQVIRSFLPTMPIGTSFHAIIAENTESAAPADDKTVDSEFPEMPEDIVAEAAPLLADGTIRWLSTLTHCIKNPGRISDNMFASSISIVTHPEDNTDSRSGAADVRMQPPTAENIIASIMPFDQPPCSPPGNPPAQANGLDDLFAALPDAKIAGLPASAASVSASGPVHSAPIASDQINRISAGNRQLDLTGDQIWLNQLARDIVASRDINDRLSFRLSPANLGRMDVEIRATENGVSLHITASSEEAAKIFAAAQPRLIDELRMQGTRVNSADIHHGDLPKHESGTHPQFIPPETDCGANTEEISDRKIPARPDSRFA